MYGGSGPQIKGGTFVLKTNTQGGVASASLGSQKFNPEVRIWVSEAGSVNSEAGS